MNQGPVKLSLIIPTMDRHDILKETLPILFKHGFHEIIVVDSSGTEDTLKNMELCKKFHAKYYHFIGNREEARNFGVQKAKSEWVYIFDDDILLQKFNWKLFEEITTKDYDFIHAKGGSYVWIFRRDFFLRIGGYDPNLCYGDDYDITVRAFKHGKAAYITNIGKFGTPITGTLKMRWKGALYYSMTMLTFFAKYPTFRIALSIPYRPAFFLQKLVQNRTRENLTKFMLTTLGTLLSPLYHIKHS